MTGSIGAIGSIYLSLLSFAFGPAKLCVAQGQVDIRYCGPLRILLWVMPVLHLPTAVLTFPAYLERTFHGYCRTNGSTPGLLSHESHVCVQRNSSP